MSNITKELSSTKKADKLKVEQDNAVKTVLLLENGDSQEDLRIANALGSDHNIARAQTELGKKLEMEKLDKRYVGNIFTREQIKKLAGKYNMRFLQSKHYCGNLDVAAISKLKEFSKLTSVELNEANLKYNFYVLAPEKCFNLEEVKKMKKDPDPALFYKVDEDHYRLIHQWGADFNIFNRIAGINWYSRKTKFWLHFIVLFVITALGVRPFVNAGWKDLASILAFVPCLIYSAVNAYNEDNFMDREFHDGKWNDTIKMRS